MIDNVFPDTMLILGTSRDSGKTVACMGIISRLLSPDYGFTPEQVGYMKPVGQEARLVTDGSGRQVLAERDAALVMGILQMPDPDYPTISPIVWSSGLTECCIDDCCSCDPQEVRRTHLARIAGAYRRLARGRRVMVIEGTGQIGVGSVAGVSGVDVAATLRAMGVPLHIILVASGERTGGIDLAVPYLMVLHHLGERVDGMIVNRVPDGALPGAAARLSRYYHQVFPALYGPQGLGLDCPEVLGIVPEIQDLALPTMRLVSDFLRAQPGSGHRVVAAPHRAQDEVRLIRRIAVLSLERGYEPLLRDGDAVVVGVNANPRIVSLVNYHARAREQGRPGLAGVLLSCGQVGGLLPSVQELLVASGLPVVALDYDSATITARLHQLVVKIQVYDQVKRDLVAAVYREHLTGLLPVLSPLRAALPHTGATAG